MERLIVKVGAGAESRRDFSDHELSKHTTAVTEDRVTRAAEQKRQETLAALDVAEETVLSHPVMDVARLTLITVARRRVKLRQPIPAAALRSALGNVT